MHKHLSIVAAALLVSAQAFAVPVDIEIPATEIKPTASNVFSPQQDALNLINGSGLNGNLHDSEGSARTMWHTGENPVASSVAGIQSPAWVRFDFTKPQAFDRILIWNHNQAGYTNRGFRKTRILGTVDGSIWKPLAELELPLANGGAAAATSVTVPTKQVVKSIVIAAESNWGGNVYGLSEVKFVATKDVPVADLPFPTGMDCAAQAIYRHRTDGQPGREIKVTFKGGKLYTAADMEVVANGKTEIVKLPANPRGLSEIQVLLPPGVGVDKDATVSVTLKAGGKNIRQSVTVPAQRQWTVFVYAHSHVDIGYTNTHDNVEIIHRRNVANGIRLAKQTAGEPWGNRYVWNPEVFWPLERYLAKATPEQAEAAYEAIRNRRLSLDASPVNTNTTICADEELFHLFHGSLSLSRKLGVQADTFVQVDIPGMSWGLIPAMRQSGVKYIFNLPNPCDRTGQTYKLHHRPFWWVGPDGVAKVLFFQPSDYGAGASKRGSVGSFWFNRDPNKIAETVKTSTPLAISPVPRMLNELAALEKDPNYPYDLFAVDWSICDNSPLDEDLLEVVRDWNKDHAYPRMVFATASDIMSAFDKKYGDRLPVVRGDFTEYWTDGLGTAAKFTGMNRNAKERLIQADTLASMLNPAKPVPRAEIEDSWHNIIMGSEHTWCYENPQDAYFQEAIWTVKKGWFQAAQDTSTALLKKAGDAVAAGPSIAVLNTLSWNRSGLVTLSAAATKVGDRIVNETGNAIPSQRLSTGELVFLASDIPALGSSLYRVQAGTATSPKTPCSINGTSAANGVLAVRLDAASGNIASLTCVGGNHEFVNLAPDGGLNAFRQLPGNSSKANSDTGIKISLKENGPLVVEWQVDSVAPGCQSVERKMRLVAGLPWLECAITILPYGVITLRVEFK